MSRFKTDAVSFKDVLNLAFVNKLTKSNLFKPCCVCGALKNVQMHHIRAVKDAKAAGTYFDYEMAMINRKQVPLCRTCHSQVHRLQRYPHLRNNPVYAEVSKFVRRGGLKRMGK